MKLDLYINEANDYARDIGMPVQHPHVSIIHYDEAGEIRHSLNRFNIYGIFLQREFPENLTYGIGTYKEGDGSATTISSPTTATRHSIDYYAKGHQRSDGLPSVKYCAPYENFLI